MTDPVGRLGEERTVRTMPGDCYQITRRLVHELVDLGQTTWATRIENALTEGATGTEVLMALRWQLGEWKRSGIRVPSMQDEIDELLVELDKLLR